MISLFYFSILRWVFGKHNLGSSTIFQIEKTALSIEFFIVANTLDRIIQIFNNLYLSQKYGKTQITFLTAVFFPINLHFITLNQVSTYRKLNFPLTSSIYFVFLPFEMQKRLKQTKVYHTFFFDFVEKKWPIIL